MKDYQLIDDLHEELEQVHEGLEQYDGIQLENGYETGPFIPGRGSIEGYEDMLENKENFDENGCLLTAASSLEEMTWMIQETYGKEHITLGRIPVEGPLGESMIDNVNLNYNMKVEDDGNASSYWELDSSLVSTDKEGAKEEVRGIESIVNEYTSNNVEQLPLDSESKGLKQIANRIE